MFQDYKVLHCLKCNSTIITNYIDDESSKECYSCGSKDCVKVYSIDEAEAIGLIKPNDYMKWIDSELLDTYWNDFESIYNIILELVDIKEEDLKLKLAKKIAWQVHKSI